MIHNQTLQNLNLSHNGLDDQCAASLSEVIKTNPSLNSLDLSYNAFTAKGFEDIARGLINGYLHELNLSSNVRLHGHSLVGFFDLLKQNNSLRKITLSHLSLSTSIEAIAEFLKNNPSLTEFNIQHNFLNDDHIKILCAIL